MEEEEPMGEREQERRNETERKSAKAERVETNE